ncbi:MAG: hypothetical protein HC839_03120, partial [Leptolyngbyaceae cyanobacterium RM2_2_21]|nr:hypothetical protein [Leptolyngbyaceae cyanobacterium RM2_2_21]
SEHQQLGANIVQYVRGRANAIANAPILMMGIVTATVLQILFSQWGVMNTLFATAPLTWQQWLICLLPILPMIPTALWVNRIDSPNPVPQEIVRGGNKKANNSNAADG